MRLSASVELVLQLAGYEAAASQFAEIEPEHLLAALLKFSELSSEDLLKLVSGSAAGRELTSETDAVRRVLAGRSINSTFVRNSVRAGVGTGGVRYQGGRLHRSAATKQVFETAAKLAAQASSDVFCAKYLLDALLRSPTSVMREVLGHAVGAVGASTATPLLDQHGKGLALADANATLVVDSSHIAACRAVARALSGSRKAPVLLISEDDRAVQIILKNLARTDEGHADEWKNTRMVDLTDLRSDDRDVLALTDPLLAEAAGIDRIVLLLPPIDVTVRLSHGASWANHLRAVLQDRSVRCVVRVSPHAYDEWVRKDMVWKELAEAIWVHRQDSKDIPLEL